MILKIYNKYNICIEGFKQYLLLSSINNLGSELVLISSISSINRLVMELILANELTKCGRMWSE